MRMSKRTLITGGTGFVGSFLAVELLKRGHFVVFLARPKDKLSAEERVSRAIKFVDPHIESFESCYRVIEGDITQKELGLSADDRNFLVKLRPTELFHSAGSVDFAEKNKVQTLLVNCGGTINILRLASDLKFTRFHHLSTLYVAGNQKGRILEENACQNQEFNNPYEESKAEAENFIRLWSEKKVIPHNIYRLPVTIGHSQTGKTSTFTGFYGFFKPFWKLQELIRERIGDPRLVEAGIGLVNGQVSAPLFVKCSKSSNIDLVPIDWIVKTIFRLSEAPLKNTTYHLSHELAPSSESVLRDALPLLGLKGLRFVNYNYNGIVDKLKHNNKTLRAFQRRLDSITEIYFDYAMNRKVFDNANLKKTLNDQYEPPPMIDRPLIQLMLTYAKMRQFRKASFA